MRKLLKNRLGFSLVEMITAFAVLGIATLAIGGFFVSSSRSYAGTSSETGIQYEAQMALNQIENKLIDATLGVNYALSDGANLTFVENDGTSGASSTAKYLYIFNSDGTNFDLLLIKWNKATSELLYKEISLGTSFAEVKDIPVETTGTWELMAENVKTFSVDLSKYVETKTVDVTLGLEKRDKEFTTTGTITLRNNILVNESDLKDIFDNLSNRKATRVDQVVLTANTNVTVPGGQVQLSTVVKGVYPSQDIHGWVIGKSCQDLANNIIGGGDHILNNGTEVDENKILRVADVTGSTFQQTVYVQAYVETVDAAGQAKTVYSNIVVINVRDITALEIWPTADKEAVGNASLFKDGDPISSWSVLSSKYAFDANKTVTIYPSNIIQMRSRIEGSVADTDTTAVLWSIESKDTDVIASINSNGVITVDKNSKSGFLNIKATLEGTNYAVIYPFMIGSPYNKDVDVVTVVGPERMDRGAAPYQCEVYLNNIKGSETDYNWSVIVTNTAGQVVTGDPVTISSSGIITVKDTLAYDYDYRVTVVAKLKSDNLIQGTDIVPVPKVSLQLTPATYRTNIGTKIPAGEIVCKVIGLANYDIKWTMAKETNPTYFFTAYGNTNITGSETAAGKSPIIVIGADEPAALTYMRVKAELVGNSNISETMKLNFTDDVIIDGPDDPVVNPDNPPVNPDGGNDDNNDDDDDDDYNWWEDWWGQGGWNPGGGSGSIVTRPNYKLQADDGTVNRNDREEIYLRNDNAENKYAAVAADSWQISAAYDGRTQIRSLTGLSIETVSGSDKVYLVVSPTFQTSASNDITVHIRATKDGTTVTQQLVTIPKLQLTVYDGDTDSSSSSRIARTTSGSGKEYYYTLNGLNASSNDATWSLSDSNGGKITLGTKSGNTIRVKTNNASRNLTFNLTVSFNNGAISDSIQITTQNNRYY